MQRYADAVLDKYGKAITGASVLVRTIAGAIATLYKTNGGGTLDNPIGTDALGRFAFYAPDGRYTLDVYVGDTLYATVPDILLEDPADESAANINGGTIKNVALENVTIDGEAPIAQAALDTVDDKADLAIDTANTANSNLSAAQAQAELALDTANAAQAMANAAVPSASLSATGGSTLVGHDDVTLDVVLKNAVGKVVSSIAALRVTDKTKYTQACVTGYYAAGDGGGGIYFYDAADTTSVDNGGTIIVANDGGRWKLVRNGWVAFETFGAKGDADKSGNGTDDTTAILAAVSWCKTSGDKLCPRSRIYKYTSGIVIDAPIHIDGDMNGVQNTADSKGAILLKRGNFIGIEVTTSAECTLENFAVDSAPGFGDTKQGIKLTACGRSKLRNVSAIRQGSHGIEFNDGNLTSFSDIHAVGNAGDGIYVNGATLPNTNACLFSSIDARSNAGHGINFETAWNVFAPSIVAQSNGSTGVRLNNCRQSHIVVYGETNTTADVELTNHANCNGNIVWVMFANTVLNNAAKDVNTLLTTANARSKFDSLRTDKWIINNDLAVGTLTAKHDAAARHDFYFGTTGQAQSLRFKNVAGLTNIDTDTAIYPVQLDWQATYPVRPRLIFADGATTPSVALGDFFLANNSSATTITNFSGGTLGQVIHVVFNNGNTTIQNSTIQSGIRLKGNANKTFAQYDGATFIANGSGWWIEV